MSLSCRTHTLLQRRTRHICVIGQTGSHMTIVTRMNRVFFSLLQD